MVNPLLTNVSHQTLKLAERVITGVPTFGTWIWGAGQLAVKNPIATAIVVDFSSKIAFKVAELGVRYVGLFATKVVNVRALFTFGSRMIATALGLDTLMQRLEILETLKSILPKRFSTEAVANKGVELVTKYKPAEIVAQVQALSADTSAHVARKFAQDAGFKMVVEQPSAVAAFIKTKAAADASWYEILGGWIAAPFVATGTVIYQHPILTISVIVGAAALGGASYYYISSLYSESLKVLKTHDDMIQKGITRNKLQDELSSNFFIQTYDSITTLCSSFAQKIGLMSLPSSKNFTRTNKTTHELFVDKIKSRKISYYDYLKDVEILRLQEALIAEDLAIVELLKQKQRDAIAKFERDEIVRDSYGNILVDIEEIKDNFFTREATPHNVIFQKLRTNIANKDHDEMMLQYKNRLGDKFSYGETYTSGTMKLKELQDFADGIECFANDKGKQPVFTSESQAIAWFKSHPTETYTSETKPGIVITEAFQRDLESSQTKFENKETIAGTVRRVKVKATKAEELAEKITKDSSGESIPSEAPEGAVKKLFDLLNDFGGPK